MQRFKQIRNHVAVIACVTSVSLFSIPLTVAHENDASAEKPKDTTPNEQDGQDPFAIPEGNEPEALQAFLNQLAQTPAAERTREGFQTHFNKLHDLSTEVFQRDVDDETRLMAVSIITGSLDVLDQIGDPTAGDRKEEFVTALKQHQRPALATRGRLLEAQQEIDSLDLGDEAAINAMIQRVVQLLQEKPLTLDHGRLAYGAVSAIEQLENTEIVSSAAVQFAKHLRTSDDSTLRGLADTLEGSARRLNLKGNPIQLSGPTLSGEEFNIDQWKGKVVIVDFWATWCGPCVAELPALKKLYETQHANGLEIVGISLDDSRAQLAEFIDQKELPWPTIFIDPEGKDGWENPLATYYGVSAIPTMFLVGRDGKVVATDLYGEDLREAVEGLMKAE